MCNKIVMGFLLGAVLGGCAHQPDSLVGEASPAPPNTDQSKTMAAEAQEQPVKAIIQDSEQDLDSLSTDSYAGSASPQIPATAEQTVKPENLWQALANEQVFAPEIKHQRIQRQMRVYTRHKKRLTQQLNRAGIYLPYIIEQLRQKQLPLELALLPMVESAYNPFAYSSSSAAGLWQFVPATADHVGLERNWWYDGRRDLVSSTEAALEYLSYLNTRFDGDWLLTLAAYNGGEGTVGRAISKNLRLGRDTSYWALDLSQETRAYVPRFLALASIIRAPHDHEFQLLELSNEINFELVRLRHSIDLQQAAFLAGIDLETLYRLNPGFLRWATPPSRSYNLALPKQSAGIFKKRLAATPRSKLTPNSQHTVESGDTLGAIARQYQISVNALMALNQLKSTLIKPGQRLKVPGKPLGPSGNRRQAQTSTIMAAGLYKRYQVKDGDTLGSIAGKNGVSVSKLVLWNQWPRTKALMAGDELVVGYESPSPGQGKVNYRVRAGDSLYKIAKKFNVAVNDIVQWNALKKRSILHPGQRLLLYPRS